MQNANGSVVLSERHVEMRSGYLANGGVFAVLRYADDFDVRPRGGHAPEVMADRILSRPKLLREEFVDHGDKWRHALVALVDRTASNDFDAHRAEIIRIHFV